MPKKGRNHARASKMPANVVTGPGAPGVQSARSISEQMRAEFSDELDKPIDEAGEARALDRLELLTHWFDQAALYYSRVADPDPSLGRPAKGQRMRAVSRIVRAAISAFRADDGESLKELERPAVAYIRKRGLRAANLATRPEAATQLRRVVELFIQLAAGFEALTPLERVRFSHWPGELAVLDPLFQWGFESLQLRERTEILVEVLAHLLVFMLEKFIGGEVRASLASTIHDDATMGRVRAAIRGILERRDPARSFADTARDILRKALIEMGLPRGQAKNFFAHEREPETRAAFKASAKTLLAQLSVMVLDADDAQGDD